MQALGLFPQLLMCIVVVLGAMIVFLVLMVCSLTRCDWPTYIRRCTDLGAAVPVIMFHDVDERQFRSAIRYLRAEGYRPMTLSQLADFITEGVSPSPKPVVLTFDDGLLSTYQIAFPLLAEQGWTAACFVAPALIGEGNLRPTLRDVKAGSAVSAALSVKRNALANWAELVHMKNAGIMEYGSHTWDHRLIFIGDELRGFANGSPRLWARSQSVPIPSDCVSVDATCWQLRAPPGRPLYAQRSRMSAAVRFIESPQVRTACETYVNDRGKALLATAAGRRDLLAVYHEAVRMAGAPGRYERAAEQEAEISLSLARSRDMLRQHLDLKEVDWLCFPYNEGSHLACRLAGAAGYRGAFVGAAASPMSPFVTRGHDIWQINRVHGLIDQTALVASLPGRSRQSFSRIVLARAWQRLREQRALV